MIQLLYETVWQFLKKLNIESPYGPTTPLLGIYPKALKVRSQRCICTPVFIAAALTAQVSIGE